MRPFQLVYAHNIFILAHDIPPWYLFNVHEHRVEFIHSIEDLHFHMKDLKQRMEHIEKQFGIPPLVVGIPGNKKNLIQVASIDSDPSTLFSIMFFIYLVLVPSAHFQC